MYPYWILFVTWAVGALQANRPARRNAQLIFFVAASALTTVMIGLRLDVGGDWGAYQRMYESIFFLDLRPALAITDPGYGMLNWLAAQFGFGIWFVNLVCAILFVGGFARLCWKQPNPALAVLVAVPYLIIVVAMGYTRQAAALGLICLAIADASERHLIRLVLLIMLATLFHKTAILVLPLALVPVFRRNWLLGAIGAAMFAILFIVFLRDTSDRMITNYAQGDYDSQGAAVRVSMNVIAAIVYILIQKNISMSTFQKSFWMTCSILSFISVAALATLSASSGVDRLSLYLIPIQAIAYSNLPYNIKKSKASDAAILIGLIVYAFLVQYVWLNYAANAGYWNPYAIGFASSA